MSDSQIIIYLLIGMAAGLLLGYIFFGGNNERKSYQVRQQTRQSGNAAFRRVGKTRRGRVALASSGLRASDDPAQIARNAGM